MNDADDVDKLPPLKVRRPGSWPTPRPLNVIDPEAILAAIEWMTPEQRRRLRGLLGLPGLPAGGETEGGMNEPTADHADELDRIRVALRAVVRADAIDAWLARPNPAFGGAAPAELVRRGEGVRIWRMIGEMEVGTAF